MSIAKNLVVGVTVALLAGCAQLSQFSDTGLSGVGIGNSGVDLGGSISAAGDLVKAASLSDEEVRSYASQFADHEDGNQKVAASESAYAQRLAKITAGLQEYDGLKLTYKVYLSPQINAFALADGNIRVYSGLLDAMTDEQVLGVIGHEIGHVKKGHSKGRMQTAYALSAARKGAASAGGATGVLASSELVGGMFESFLKAQYSQSNEEEADEYGVHVLAAAGGRPEAAAEAMEVLAEEAKKHGGDTEGFSFFSTHPAPLDRAQRLRRIIADEGIVAAKRDTNFSPSSSGDSEPETRVAMNKESADEHLPSKSESEQGQVISAEPAVAEQHHDEGHASTVAVAAVGRPQVEHQADQQPSGGTHYIQVAVVSSAEEARQQAEELLDFARSTATQHIEFDQRQGYRVLIGPFPSAHVARQKLASYKAQELVPADAFINVLTASADS